MRTYKEILTDVYKEYNPEKVKDVDGLLTKYKGQEKQVLEDIFAKYNVSHNERIKFVNPTLYKEYKQRNDQPTQQPVPKSNDRKKYFIGLLLIITFIVTSIIILRSGADNKSNMSSNGSGLVRQVDTVITQTERKKIIDALRLPVQGELHQQVKFVISKISRCNEWIVISAKPIQTNGSPIDYSYTKYQSMINDGVFDDGVLAVLQRINDDWMVREYQIGGTDSPAAEWIKKYNLQKCSRHLGLSL